MFQALFCCIPLRRLSILEPSSQYFAMPIMIRSIAEQGIHLEIAMCHHATRLGASPV